jgi:hypothetical protein
MTSAAAASQSFRGVDWVALGSLALTVVLVIIIIAGLKTALIPFDVLNAMSTGVWLVAICGPVAGIVALSESKGRPKWPGVLALFSPVVAGFGSLLAFAIVWSGNT